MVGWIQILFDVTSVVIFVAILPVALALFYLLAWKESAVFRESPITPTQFWVLVVGGLIGSLANIPFFYFRGSIMAINVGGAVAPLLISATLVYSLGRDRGKRFITGALAVWAGSVTVATALVALGEAPWFVVLGSLVVAPALPVIARKWNSGELRAASVVYGILMVVMSGTFLTTQVIPSEGIVSAFPDFLLPPVLASLLSLLFFRMEGGRLTSALPLAYVTATLGDLVGADVVHQPQLYAPGVPTIFGAIGGAGVQDLVYLSGLIALCVTYVLVVLIARMTSGTKAPVPPAASGMLAAMASFESLQYDLVPRQVQDAVNARASHVSAFLGVSGLGTTVGVGGNPAHPLMAGDYANLTRGGTTGPINRETAHKALSTGFYLMRSLDQLVQRKLATMWLRSGAFVVDLLITIGPAGLALWGLYFFWHLDGVFSALASLDYEAAMLAAASYPFVLFVASEWRTGKTPGKWLLRVRVHGRGLGQPTLLEVFIRNIPKLLTTTALGLSLGIAIPLVLSGFYTSFEGLVIFLGGIGVAIIVGGVALLTIATNLARRRIGDLMAGTVVSNERPIALPWTPSPAASLPSAPG